MNPGPFQRANIHAATKERLAQAVQDARKRGWTPEGAPIWDRGVYRQPLSRPRGMGLDGTHGQQKGNQ